MTKRKQNSKLPRPLAPPPQMASRKKARKVTTLFHTLTRQLDQAKIEKDDKTVSSLQKQIKEMGGREEYQRASQLSTKFHSTSKWVLGELGQIGWLHGGLMNSTTYTKSITKGGKCDNNKTPCVRPVNVLEVGAINSELVDAPKKTRRLVMMKKGEDLSNNCSSDERNDNQKDLIYKLHVRAIDLQSSNPQIEEQDFLSLPPPSLEGNFDVIVCSMVLNCVTTARNRGKMLSLLFRQLHPGGLCFLTIPKLCLDLSPYMTRNIFESILVNALGFIIEKKKDSPKVAFWVLKRPLLDHEVSCDTATSKRTLNNLSKYKEQWTKPIIVKKGKKYRNDFSVDLDKSYIIGS